jgi:hypothetical protein
MKKKIDLGQAINTLANIGVILGIVFLALEINQNNRLLRAQAASSMVDARNEVRTLIVGSGEVAEFWARVASGEPLRGDPPHASVRGGLGFTLTEPDTGLRGAHGKPCNQRIAREICIWPKAAGPLFARISRFEST